MLGSTSLSCHPRLHRHATFGLAVVFDAAVDAVAETEFDAVFEAGAEAVSEEDVAAAAGVVVFDTVAAMAWPIGLTICWHRLQSLDGVTWVESSVVLVDGFASRFECFPLHLNPASRVNAFPKWY